MSAAVEAWSSTGLQAATDDYRQASLRLPAHEQQVREFARGDGDLEAAVERQERAAQAWIDDYAEPRMQTEGGQSATPKEIRAGNRPVRRDPQRSPDDHAGLRQPGARRQRRCLAAVEGHRPRGAPPGARRLVRRRPVATAADGRALDPAARARTRRPEDGARRPRRPRRAHRTQGGPGGRGGAQRLRRRQDPGPLGRGVDPARDAHPRHGQGRLRLERVPRAAHAAHDDQRLPRAGRRGVRRPDGASPRADARGDPAQRLAAQDAHRRPAHALAGRGAQQRDGAGRPGLPSCARS